jgi:hypothetical protein
MTRLGFLLVVGQSVVNWWSVGGWWLVVGRLVVGQLVVGRSVGWSVGSFVVKIRGNIRAAAG